MAAHMKNTDILMVGKTGNGKSSLGNMILQKKAFKSRNDLESVTKDIQYGYSDFEGTAIKVVDGPGVCDTMKDKVKAVSIVVDAMSNAVFNNPNGFHAILIVLRYGCRYTDEDVKTVEVLKDIFGESSVTNHGILVMTCGDMFTIDSKENDNETFEHWCQIQCGIFSELLAEVKNRAILFNNRAKGNAACEQIRRLLHMIKSLCSNGARYTSKVFMEAKLSRERLIVETKRPQLQKNAMHEAELITQLLGRPGHGSPEKELGRLSLLKARAEILLQTVIEQDKGTKSLTASISVADNLIKTLTCQIEQVKRSIRLQEKEEKQTANRGLLPSSNDTAYYTKNADILLVGKISVGKSSLGNMILQKKVFKSKSTSGPVTKEIQFDYSQFEDTLIKIVDVPGVDNSMEDKETDLRLVVEAMTRAVITSTEGFHAILIVVRYGGRFTDEDAKTIKVLKDIFGEAFVSNHGILVMTCGDLFFIDAEESDDDKFEYWCQRQGGHLGELFKEVQNRDNLFDNKAKGEAGFEQIRRLLRMIDGLSDNGARYTSKIFSEAKISRERLMVRSKRPLLQENTIREAGIINQLLDRVDHSNPEKELDRLNLLKTRAENLLQSVIEQDKGTKSLSSAISVADNLVKTLTGQVEQVKRAVRLQKEKEELRRKMREEKHLLQE